MDEYISKEFMLENLEADKMHNAEHCEPVTVQIMERFIRYVKEFPAADVQPVKHGRWVRTDKSTGVETVYVCSECGYQVRKSDRTNYCGDCGSKLDIIYQDDKVTAIKVTGGDME